MGLEVDFFLVAGIVINSILLFQLLKKDTSSNHNRILISIFFLILSLLLNTYATLHGLTLLSVLTFVFQDGIEWFMGPLLFLYIKSLFTTKKDLDRKYGFHLVLPILYLLLISVPILFNALNGRVLHNYVAFLHGSLAFQLLVAQLYLMAYLSYSLYLFLSYQNRYQLIFSPFKKQDFLWIRNLILGILGTSFIYFCTIIIELIFDFKLNSYSYMFSLFLVTLLLTYLGYHGFNQSKIFIGEANLDVRSKAKDHRKKSYQISRLTSEEVEDLKKRLYAVFKNDRPYLDENLTLKKTADLLQISDKKLSELLNNYLKTSFYDFVNSYRIDAVKERLHSKDALRYTLMAIAYDCGFTSKTSFYRAFKKSTGYSPATYRKNVHRN